MWQNDKLETELQLLREENARLKAELSASKTCSFEKDLQQKEEQLRSIYELTHVIPWSYDLVNHKLDGPVHFRRAWEGKLPNSKKEIELFFSKIHKDDRAKVDKILKNPYEYPEFEFNYRYHGDDDILHYFNSKGRVVIDASTQKAIKLIGVNREITEQQRIKKKLHLQEALLYNAYKLANISVWSYDFEKDKLTGITAKNIYRQSPIFSRVKVVRRKPMKRSAQLM